MDDEAFTCHLDGQIGDEDFCCGKDADLRIRAFFGDLGEQSIYSCLDHYDIFVDRALREALMVELVRLTPVDAS